MNANEYNAQAHSAERFRACRVLGFLPAAFPRDPGGDAEAAAVRAVQAAVGVEADGKLGPGTVAALRAAAWPDRAPIPYGVKAIVGVYGDPKYKSDPKDARRLTVSATWRATEIVKVTFASGDAAHLHRVCAAEAADLYRLACEATGYRPGCDGGLVPRRKNWSDDPKASPSTHTFGIALDFDAQANARGLTKTPMRKHRLWPAIWEAAGWVWGGDFPTPDDMHFQRCDGL